MATYDFQCPACGDAKLNYHIRMTEYDEKRPQCCGGNMQQVITHAPMVHWKDPAMDATPMPAIPGNPVITSRKQRRELMARHDLVDANDMKPPTQAEEAASRAEVQKSIEAISAPEGVDLSSMDIV